MRKILAIAFLVFLVPAAYSAHKSKTLTVVTLNDRARLCPVVDCDQDKELLRIPTGTKLKTLALKITKNSGVVVIKVKWYKVTYNGQTGWISEYNF